MGFDAGCLPVGVGGWVGLWLVGLGPELDDLVVVGGYASRALKGKSCWGTLGGWGNFLVASAFSQPHMARCP